MLLVFVFRILHTNNYVLYLLLILYINQLLRLLLLNINFSSKMFYFLFQVFIRKYSTSSKKRGMNEKKEHSKPSRHAFVVISGCMSDSNYGG
jgi:hypothetical protein